jgi:hypothetical protein
MKHKLNLVLFLFILAGCSQKQPTADTSNAITLDSISKDSSTTELTDEDILKTIPKNIKPILGYRFVIKGDFDGDGKKENLVEHFYSSIDNKETNKFYDGLDNYEQLVALTIKKMPYSFVLSDNAKIDTLSISISAQLLGLSYLKNEGDLNGDGTDEVSYVVNWADWSNMNTWHIMTYKSNRWEELYSFPIWDWQLPDLPETFNNYGLFGLQDKVMVPEDDSVNLLIEQNMQQFKGLVKKMKINQIQVIFKNEEASEDTMLVDLTKKMN